MIRSGIFAAVLAAVVLPAHAQVGLSGWAGIVAPTQATPNTPLDASAKTNSNNPALLTSLVAEALENNPEIRAALRERDAASQRIAPAAALDDPVLEAGVINAPLASSPFNREDMTMKMIGLSQRLPFPGKRGLRQDVAAKDAEAVGYGYQETVNRVARDIKTAYFDLGLTLERTGLVEKNKLILERFLRIAEGRYEVGQGSQADVLKAQTQVSRMVDELLRLARERPTVEAELIRALGRNAIVAAPVPEPPQLREEPLNLESLRETALTQRPQLLALQSIVARNEKALDLARKELLPRLRCTLVVRPARQHAGRHQALRHGDPDCGDQPAGVARKQTRAARSRGLALRDQAQSMYQAQRNEVAARLRQQTALAEQNLKSARLYQTAILPQARLTVESALAAYRVNRVDFLTLLDSQMTVFNYEISLVTAMARLQQGAGGN